MYCACKHRAVLNYSGVREELEGKLVLQVFKALMITGLLAWLTVACKEYLYSNEVSVYLQAFRNRLSTKFYLPDFVYDPIRQLLGYVIQHG